LVAYLDASVTGDWLVEFEAYVLMPRANASPVL
jgi:hypothetical protein